MTLRIGFIQILLFISATCVAQDKKSTVVETPADSTFVNLKTYSDSIIFDMKYATDDNFLKAKVYDCAECFLRYKTVKSLIEANEKFLKLGYRIKIFDCYRPLDVQKIMWKLVPNPIYVADPSKGSIHNRGGAVDLTLVDVNGKELDMGTSFDHFGIESAHDYTGTSALVRTNRTLLKSVMESCLFLSFRSEWWHYNLKTDATDKVSNFKWECN
ncbi:M15 family metallopeptidase [Flavobacterium sp.]|jgi:D-alanyl-D-alanine dipeptidase|uniref:M15 family metallopeptidase n=1 Tax=Flavobacterium sp. TaxID=239 RepID=UPI0037C11353